MLTFRLTILVSLAVLQFANNSWAQSGSPLLQNKEKLLLMESVNTSEALNRKKRSESLLRAEGVPINPTLPIIESEREVRQRSKEEIAFRALSLLVVSLKGESLEEPLVQKLVKEYGLESKLTPQEKAFINNPNPSQKERVKFSWQYETAWVLLWALGYVENLEKPTQICDVPRAVGFMKDRKKEVFIAQSKLRPMREMLDQADRIYRYHWAVVDARINGRQAPAGLNADVTMERHHALNWLIGYMDQDWDDITTDT